MRNYHDALLMNGFEKEAEGLRATIPRKEEMPRAIGSKQAEPYFNSFVNARQAEQQAMELE